MWLLTSWPRACHDSKEQVHGKADKAEADTEAETEAKAEVKMVLDAGA